MPLNQSLVNSFALKIPSLRLCERAAIKLNVEIKGNTKFCCCYCILIRVQRKKKSDEIKRNLTQNTILEIPYFERQLVPDFVHE